ncbi:hypothetical protein [Nonomuraea sp. NPDC050310]|uniref:hypothetical protein n=1 Tax=Nonomuraea sp. NPDC050310 TaxID=3154935 RepID=UPI0033F6457D
MTMPKRGSRPITVDGVVYRWRVPKWSRGVDGGWKQLSFTVQRADEPGGVLVVTLPCARPDNSHGERTIVVRPVLVSACIRRALGQGWAAHARGAAFRLTVTEAELPELLGEEPKYMIPFLWGMIHGVG